LHTLIHFYGGFFCERTRAMSWCLYAYERYTADSPRERLHVSLAFMLEGELFVRLRFALLWDPHGSLRAVEIKTKNEDARTKKAEKRAQKPFGLTDRARRSV
jgi:hypothetical protein